MTASLMRSMQNEKFKGVIMTNENDYIETVGFGYDQSETDRYK